MAAAAILFFLEARFLLATKGIVIVLCCRKPISCLWIIILRTILLSTCPTPRATAPQADMEFVSVVKATRENIGTRIVFQTPTRAPRTLLRICRPFFFHFSLIFSYIDVERRNPHKL
jgi:hypothetical protein